jgi:CubicO group peptidase (beta-lactamase class C family)
MGETVEQKATLPLVFEPGKEFAYGVGVDWAGKMVERVTGKVLEEYMKEKIWGPLGIKDITFYPKQRADMEGRIAGMSNLGESGECPATDDPEFDVLGGATDCLGGGGAFASTEAYFTFLRAILRHDQKLLSSASFDELLKPQLSQELKVFFNDYLHSDPLRAQYLGMGISSEVKKTWCFAGMMCEDGQIDRFSRGTIFWGGVPSMAWWIDSEKGICGVAACQVLPPMSPKIMQLHEQFQKRVFNKFGGTGL